MDSELEKYRLFVKAVAKRYASNEAEMEELIAEGTIGLVEAAEHFNEDSGIQFISYAVWYIRRSIESYIRSKKDVRVGPTSHKKRNLD